jgi:hypothetical protein
MKSKFFILKPFAFAFVIVFGCAFVSACGNSNDRKISSAEAAKLTCEVGVYSDNFVAGFPVSDFKQKEWIWNKNWLNVSKRDQSMGFDYSWIVEPGNMKNGIFVPAKYAFGSGHLNTYYLNKGEVHGTISELIATMKLPSSVYLNDADPAKRWEESKKIGDLPVYIQQVDNKLVIVYSRSLAAIKVVFSDRPEYAKMTMKTPYPSQSYSCMVKIYYDNSKKK